jgi:hypothetical protein
MKLFQSRGGRYAYDLATIDGTNTLWATRLGTIATIRQMVADGLLQTPETDSDDDLIIDCAEHFMQFVHVFGHAGQRFEFTGLLDGAKTKRGARFFDQERMIEVHVWPETKNTLIVIYHFHTNIEYRVRVVPNFR